MPGLRSYLKGMMQWFIINGSGGFSVLSLERNIDPLNEILTGAAQAIDKISPIIPIQ